VVTAVISLMASIVSASVSESRQKAEDAHMKTEVQQVRNAVEQYRQDNGGVPVPTAGSYVAGSMVTEDTIEYESAMQKLVPKYMPEVPTSPSGSSYSYLATTDSEDAIFAAALNNDETSTNSNSCETVRSGIENCRTLNAEENGVYMDVEWACDTYSYDENTEFCIDVSTAGGLCEFESCDYYSDDETVISNSICQDIDNASGEEGQCTYSLGGYYEFWMCDIIFGVCTGTSNSEYCSCI